MRKIECATVLSLLAVSMIGQLTFAQNSTALLVVPSKATMLVGDTHTFRAVGRTVASGTMSAGVSRPGMPPHSRRTATRRSFRRTNHLHWF